MSRPLTALVLLAILLRIPALDAGLWYDEIATLVDFGSLPFGALLTTYGSDNNHPLFTLLAWLSLQAFGPSEWALRLPAAVFGAASVGMFAVFASRVAPRNEALLGTALLAISYHHVWFSQNARGYTALMFFTLAATHLMLERRWILYGASIALATYTHATGAFVAMAHGIVLLSMLAKKDPSAKGLALGLGIGAVGSVVLYLPILGEMFEFLTAKKDSVASEWTSPWWTLRAAAESFGPGAIAGLALAVVGLIAWWRQDRKLVIAFVGPGIIGALVMIALGRNLWPRFFFFLFGFAILIAVRGLAVVSKKKWMFPAGAAVLMLGSLVILPRAYAPKQDFEGAREWVEREKKPGEVIMTAGLTVLPYQRWLKTDYVSIDSVDALDRAITGGGLLLHTLSTFLESRRPELAREVKRRGIEVARFRGTLGDGDVVVLRFQAAR